LSGSRPHDNGGRRERAQSVFCQARLMLIRDIAMPKMAMALLLLGLSLLDAQLSMRRQQSSRGN